MTAHKHFKTLVRTRMGKTGESYATARRQILLKPDGGTDALSRSTSELLPEERWHLPGNIPATTALRIVLTAAGVRDPREARSGAALSEAMVFGMAGGIGCGVAAFFYEKENFASFFVAGRHGWQDDLTYVTQVCSQLGIKPVVRESGGEKAAEKHLRELLDLSGPCIAWVDSTHLPHRAMPQEWSGGGYHVITVYRIDDAKGIAWIGDLTDDAIEIPLAELAVARSRIKKFKNRLLAIPKSDSDIDLPAAIRAGLQLCHTGLTGKPIKGYPTTFNLDAFKLWAERLHGSKHKEAWERVFAHPKNLWRALTSVYDFIEHYGTGGGLCRPIFADFLSEAAQRLTDGATGKLDAGALRGLAARYEELGRGWTELAHLALPLDVPLMREARELMSHRAELRSSSGAEAVEEIRAVWVRLGELATAAAAEFPLSAGESAALRADLQKRVFALHGGEVAAHAALGDVIR